MIQVLTADYAHHILALLREATTTVDVLCYVTNFNPYKRSDNANLIYQALKKFQARGGSVKIVLDSLRKHKTTFHCNKFSSGLFRDAGFDVRWLQSGDTLHAKVLIFDDKIAVVGSHNLTVRSVINRFDVSFIFKDLPLVKFFRKYFNTIWEMSLEG